MLFFCGVLSLGLPAAVWHYYEKLDSRRNLLPTSIREIPNTQKTAKKAAKSNTGKKSFCFGFYVQILFPVKRIVGFFTGWESTEITKVQLKKLTHAVFSFVHMNSDGQLQFTDERWKRRFIGMKNKAKEVNSDLKVMISIGGEDNSQHFSRIITDPVKRKVFINTIASFIKDNKIDGVNVFWKWPKESEKMEFSEFLEELKKKLGNHILSITAPAVGIELWECGFDLDSILNYVDFINVWSMDYYGPWDNQWGAPVGPSAPLYSGVGARKNFNVNHTMQYYISSTEQPQKFNIVIPFYARLWKNVTEPIEPGKEVFRNSDIVNGKPEGNPYMNMGTLSQQDYFANPTWNEETKSSYVYDPEARTYVTMETEKSMKAKIELARTRKLGGVWIWSVDMDDVTNKLLNTLTKKILS